MGPRCAAAHRMRIQTSQSRKRDVKQADEVHMNIVGT